MEVLFDRVAGLDVGKASLTACVRTPGPRGRRSETRTFKTTVGSLRVMRDWLVGSGVTIAGLELTSTYWKAPFYCLGEVMEVWLLNAAHMKAVPGRKTDVKDAEWIAQLLEHGLLSPSIVPPPDIRRLRMLTRCRVQLMGDRTREITRLQLRLEDASVKLSSIAPSLTSVSAQARGDAALAEWPPARGVCRSLSSSQSRRGPQWNTRKAHFGSKRWGIRDRPILTLRSGSDCATPSMTSGAT